MHRCSRSGPGSTPENCIGTPWRRWRGDTMRQKMSVIGQSPDRLTPQTRLELAGKYVALEIYNPQNLALRRIEAIGDSLEECVRMLKSRGLDPKDFEFTRLGRPW